MIINKNKMKIYKDECQVGIWVGQSDHGPCGILGLNDSAVHEIKCTNTVGSYICSCGKGWDWFQRDGLIAYCTDINECTNAAHGCHHMAECTNTLGKSFIFHGRDKIMQSHENDHGVKPI